MASTTILDARASPRDGRSPEAPQELGQSAPAPDAALPTIEGYQDLERVGFGGMGVVYAATAVASGRRVALKVVRPEQHGLAAVERIQREVRALCAVRHPGIVEYLDHGLTTDGTPYVAMAWLDGVDLQQRLQDGPLPLDEALALAVRVAGALAAAHEQGVIHRDVKPANIFLVNSRPELACVLDFGVARLETRTWTLTVPGGIIGTPAYMAPEQARGGSEIDRRVDLFSLGCVLHECLCGEPAFGGEHVMAVLAKVLMEDPPRLQGLVPGVPAALDRLVASLLEKDPSKRPASAHELEQQLRALSLARDVTDERGSEAIGSQEQVFHSLLFFRGLPPEGAERPDLARLAEDHGSRHVTLVDGTGLVYMERGGVPSDRAAAAARCALALRERAPWLAIAVVSGQGVVTRRSIVGRVLDRGAELLLRTAPGRIRIDEATTSLLDTAFEIASDDEGMVLAAVHDVLPGARRLLGSASPLVGRRKELARLEAAFDECAEERCAGAVVVIGDAGVGKSRLRHELDARLRARPRPPAAVLIGRADPMRTQVPFSLMARVLAGAAGLGGGEPDVVRQQALRARLARHLGGEEAERFARDLGELISAAPHEVSLELERARQLRERIEAAWCAWLRAECAAGPVLLVLEDLHWADAATVQLVDAALAALEGSPLLVLALARPTVRQRFPRLWRARSPERVELAPLSSRASRELVRAVLGSRITDDDVERIVKGAGGNAFFLEELLRAHAAGSGSELPDSVLGMMQARLDGLPTAARRLLRAASVFGHTLWSGGIRELLGPDVDAHALAASFERLVEDEWLVPRERSQIPSDDEYAFRHALVSEAAYATLTDADRRLAHRIAGQWLERAGVREAAVLAEHFQRGEDHARATQWLASAADQAFERHELHVVLDVVERGLPHAIPGEARGRLLLRRAEVLAVSGRHREAAESALAALAELPPGSPSWYSAAGEAALASGRVGDGVRVREVIDALMPRIEPPRVGEALHLLGLVRAALPLAAAGQADAAIRLLDEIIRVTAAMVDRDPHAAGPMDSARTLRAMVIGDYGTAYRAMQSAAEVYERAGSTRNAVEHWGGAGFCALELGDLAAGEVLLRRTIERAAELRLEHVGAVARHNLGRRIGEAGRVEEGLALEQAALASFEHHGNRRMMGLTRCHTAWILLQAGRVAEAVPHVELALAELEEHPASRMIALATRAWIGLRSGEAERALADARAAIEGLEALGRVQEGESLVRLTWAEALASAGRPAEARQAIRTAHRRLLERAEPIEDLELRASFLGKVPENASIMAYAETWRDA